MKKTYEKLKAETIELLKVRYGSKAAKVYDIAAGSRGHKSAVRRIEKLCGIKLTEPDEFIIGTIAAAEMSLIAVNLSLERAQKHLRM